VNDPKSVVIPGNYQHRAATEGPAIQRFWHFTKRLAVDRYLPPQPTDLVIDAGCGSGVVTSHLGASGATVIGIDPNAQSIDYASRTFGRANITFINTTIERLQLERPADKIYNLEVIEHLTGDEASVMLRHFHAALRPGGRLFMTTPNLRSAWPIIEWTVDRTGLVAPMGGAQHVEMYHRKKLAEIARAHGFTVVAIRSMCLLSPWAAAISWRAARWLFDVEAALPGVMGPVLVAVFEKDGARRD
jgi:2-polyprenyl-3-methyl-5-hydroxy-6-metoxy-1,4-benzoquinol methylase